MSGGDPKYQAAILRGLAGYAHARMRWPEEIPGLGRAQGGCPLARCQDCHPRAHPHKRSTFVRYAGVPLCLTHALRRLKIETGKDTDQGTARVQGTV